jgi:2-keto-4-pentenoate hydratase/2-oxohepta-3-ene-1,7-dioic acid hydratase in catechol pathway
MKIGFYDDYRPCLVKENGVVDISDDVRNLPSGSPQLLLENIILNWDSLRPRLQDKWNSAPVTASLQQARLRAPVPRPGKVLMGQGNFMETVKIEPPRPLSTFFKSPDSVIGDGDTVELPGFRPVIFNHEAELCVVIGQPAKRVSEGDALSHVFGYTTGVDVSARAPEEGEAALAGNYGKSFDTFLPIGPAITTADEIPDPNNLRVQYWVNERLRQDYNTSDMEHSVAYMIATLSWNMTLKPGDLIMCGTNHGNLGPLQDGDLGEIEIEKVGRSHHHVTDELKRTWDPMVVRNPADNAARRETMKGAPNAGTWPFQAKGGQPRQP